MFDDDDLGDWKNLEVSSKTVELLCIKAPKARNKERRVVQKTKHCVKNLEVARKIGKINLFRDRFVKQSQEEVVDDAEDDHCDDNGEAADPPRHIRLVERQDLIGRDEILHFFGKNNFILGLF